MYLCSHRSWKLVKLYRTPCLLEICIDNGSHLSRYQEALVPSSMLGNIMMFDAIMAYCVICAVRDIGCFVRVCTKFLTSKTICKPEKPSSVPVSNLAGKHNGKPKGDEGGCSWDGVTEVYSLPGPRHKVRHPLNKICSIYKIWEKTQPSKTGQFSYCCPIKELLFWPPQRVPPTSGALPMVLG